MPSTLKKATIAWAILGIPVLLILLFCRDWDWLMVPYMIGVFVLALINPARRAESGRLTESPMPLVWLAIPAVALLYLAVYLFNESFFFVALIIIGVFTLIKYWSDSRGRQSASGTQKEI